MNLRMAQCRGSVYDAQMSSRNKATRKSATHTLGAKAFASISAVEGLHLSAASQKRLDELKAAGLSHDEMRAAILRTYKTHPVQE